MKKEKKKSQENEKPGISRRAFLRGAGLTTAGTVLAGSGIVGIADKKVKTKEKTLGPNSVPIDMRVNTKTYRINVHPNNTLSEILRDNLEMTGTKVGCDRGSCGACTVWLDELPVNSCMILAIEVGDQEVTTIEGLAKNGKLHPVQEAFIEEDATQCGFCTPGMIMSITHHLESNPNASLTDVKRAISGNLCRCGTQPHIFKASMNAAKKIRNGQ
jgi:carbon-monoxide dehydrogenase small subunit/xanthine dehydrogenase YagT iron-sulfur-binding subunit